MLNVQVEAMNFFDVGRKAVGIKNMIEALIKTVDDLEEVVKEAAFGKYNRNQAFFVLNNVRKKRINNNNVTKQQFIEKFNVNQKEAIEELFIDKIAGWEMKKFKESKLTPEQLYDLHKQELYRPFHGVVQEYLYSLKSI